MINQTYFIAQSSSVDLIIDRSAEALTQGLEYSKVAVVAALAAGVCAQLIKSLRS